MRLLYSLVAATLMTVLLPVLHASAFTSDPASGTNPDGSPPLCGSRRSNPFHVFRRGGPKRGRLGRSELDPAQRLPVAGWT